MRRYALVIADGEKTQIPLESPCLLFGTNTLWRPPRPGLSAQAAHSYSRTTPPIVCLRCSDAPGVIGAVR
jgi:hypothetical protein